MDGPSRQFAGLLLALGLAAGGLQARGAGPDDAPDWEEPGEELPADLTQLGLEDLMNIQVTSVARRPQRVSEAPAAVSVVSPDDVRRSGLTSVPELLRLVPGMQVARVDAGNWAISSRGFNDVFSNKLLVLIDGRTVYNPAFSGVFWNEQDLLLQDVDRVEAIRGPGASLWGANAVNGVVNVTTKSARDTQGLLLSGTAGTGEQIGAIRYGGTIDPATFYRVYTKYRYTDEFETPAGGPEADDAGQLLMGGLRLDRYASDADVLTFQGELFGGDQGETLRFPTTTAPFSELVDDTVHHSGGHALGRWTHAISDRSDLALQLYYDQFRYDGAQGEYTQRTVDLDFQHHFPLGDRQEIVWGGGYRFLNDEIHDSRILTIDRETRNRNLFTAFVQDDFTLVPRRLHLVLGSKFEHNDLTGFEVQPTVRGIWTPDEHNTVWAAVSRAVRTPTTTEDQSRVFVRSGPTPQGLPFAAEYRGNGDVESENLIAYELGYRVAPARNVTLDLAAFVNVYDDLRSIDPGAPTVVGTPPAATVVIPNVVHNRLFGESYGVEAAAAWEVSANWKLRAAYSFLDLELHRRADATDPSSEHFQENSSPRNQFQVGSYFDITRNLEFNALLFYVENLNTGNPAAGNVDVPSYVRLDLNLVWRPRDGLEVQAGVQNLLDDRHREFTDTAFNVATEVPRTFFVQATWRF